MSESSTQNNFRIAQYNPIGRSQLNAAHHYDLSDTLYDLFLDKDRQYSCAYYLSENENLEQAQTNKKRHIAAKLLLSKKHSILDIGSGWGGLGLYLAKVSGANVTGVTLSKEQQKVSQERAVNAGLSNTVSFKLLDYRKEKQSFDRIVSVGMFEHVGVGHYKEFFTKIRSLLNDDGVALIHTIGRADGPGSTNPWIAKYIFPGGYTPALSEIVPIVEQVGLYVTDIEILRLHYASTLRAWRRNFNVNRNRIKEIYDEPKNLPIEIKTRVSKKIKKTKKDLKSLYSSPKDAVERAQRWVALQIIKSFFGMPVIPGK